MTRNEQLSVEKRQYETEQAVERVGQVADGPSRTVLEGMEVGRKVRDTDM